MENKPTTHVDHDAANKPLPATVPAKPLDKPLDPKKIDDSDKRVVTGPR